MQDYIAMVMIWYATQAAADAMNPVNDQEVIAQLQKIEKLIDSNT
jgi:cell division protein ZapA